MREFYHNDLHNEATQFTNGNTTIANMVSARVAKVPAERMPYFTGGCMGCTFPFSFGTSKALIMECREKSTNGEWERVKDVCYMQNCDENSANYKDLTFVGM